MADCRTLQDLFSGDRIQQLLEVQERTLNQAKLCARVRHCRSLPLWHLLLRDALSKSSPYRILRAFYRGWTYQGSLSTKRIGLDFRDRKTDRLIQHPFLPADSSKSRSKRSIKVSRFPRCKVYCLSSKIDDDLVSSDDLGIAWLMRSDIESIFI